MNKNYSVTAKRAILLLSAFCLISAMALAQNTGTSVGKRRGRPASSQNAVAQQQSQQAAQNRPEPGKAIPQQLIPVEISGSLKTMLKSDYMTFCNIPLNLPISVFGEKMEDADFDFEEELTNQLMDMNGNLYMEAFSGIFPAMQVNAYVHYNDKGIVYRVEIQTMPNSDGNTQAMFNNWHNRLQVYIDGGKDDHVDDPMAFSQSGPGIYNITFFASEGSEDPIKGWILLKIRYRDKSEEGYDEKHSSYVTVDYIDYHNAPAEYKQSSN